MHVILVGAGVGGLCAALHLAARGIEASVVERSPVLAETGAGIQLSPNATRILFGLGLEQPLRAAASAPEAAEVRDHASGALLLRTELGRAAERRWGAPYLQLHRGDLQQLLLEALRASGQRLVLGAAVEAVRQDPTGVQAEMAGATLGGDVLIGCDGVRSTVRAALWGAAPARFTGQTAWRGLVEADRLQGAAVAPCAMVWTGGGRHFVHYPVRGGRLVNFVGVTARRGWRAESWTEPGEPAELQADFAGWPTPVAAIAAAAGQAWRYAIHDRPALPRWSRGRISLMGDAAHPAPPFLAQGAAMAVEDAEALARRLASSLAPEQALRAYERERRARTAQVQAWSRRNAGLFHLPGPLARGLFGAVGAADRLRGRDPASRLDWLYGHAGPA